MAQTKSGFEFELTKESMNDMELLEELAELDSGNPVVLGSVLERLLGKKGKKNLYDHVRIDGRVPIDSLVNELKEMMNITKALKN